MDITKEVILIANGRFPNIGLISDSLPVGSSVVCCDGAVSNAHQSGITPDVIIGDMDSIDPDLFARYKDRAIKIDDQKTNDLFKALKWLNGLEIDSVTIIGADGLREDHSLGNILLLLENSYSYKIRMVNEFGSFDLLDGERQLFQSFKGQAVSVFCLDKDVKINSSGLKYPLEDFSFSRLYDASLNVATGGTFVISCNKSDINLLVYRANEENR